MNLQKATVVILATLFVSLALAEDFNTISGKEYKSVTVTRVEPDGIVLKSKSGISKVYFVELPTEVQQRFHYDAARANTYSAEQVAAVTSASKSAISPDATKPVPTSSIQAASPCNKSTSVEQLHRIGAICRDGSESGATRLGACSRHGGVRCWKLSDGTCHSIATVQYHFLIAAWRTNEAECARSMKFWETIRAAISPQAKVNQLNAEAKKFFDKLVTTGRLSVPDNIPLVLGADETALLHEPSKLIEARATRVYSGGGVRVKGIYIGGGQSSSVQGLKQIDSGTLTLTTKRMVFTGSMESRVDNINDIVSVEPLADAIEVSTGKKAKRQIYSVRNPVIWTMLVGYVAKGKLSANVIKPVDSSADIRFNCPRCGQHLSVEQGGAGSAVNCPSCNEQIEIPHGSTRPPPVPHSE